MRIGVVGGCGYIGSHLCRRLERTNHDVMVFDNLENGHKDMVNFPVFVGDLKNIDDVKDFIVGYKPNIVIHLASYIEAGESMKKPIKYFENNCIGSLNLFNSMKDNNITDVIFASTAGVYKEHSYQMKETWKKEPSSFYGKTKLITEELLKRFCSEYDFNSIVFRFFNVAGASPYGDIGELHEPESHLIPIIIEYMLNKRDEFYIYGNDYNTTDGTCVRDYIHVEDLVDAFMMGIKKLNKIYGFNDYNIGSGKGYSVLDIFNEIKRTMYPEKSQNHCFRGFKYGDRRDGDPDSLVADISKIKREWNWEPQRGLKDIINSAIKWHKSLMN